MDWGWWRLPNSLCADFNIAQSFNHIMSLQVWVLPASGETCSQSWKLEGQLRWRIINMSTSPLCKFSNYNRLSGLWACIVGKSLDFKGIYYELNNDYAAEIRIVPILPLTSWIYNHNSIIHPPPCSLHFIQWDWSRRLLESALKTP